MRLFVLVCLIVFSWGAQASIDFLNLQAKAQLSALAYEQPNKIIQTLENMGYQLIRQSQLPETQVSYFLVKKKNEQVLVVRGTANLENVLVDLDMKLKLDSQLNIQLHQGFALAAQAIYQDVKLSLDSSTPIITTGHSLGGAVALILAMHLANDEYPLTQSMTFGQPKVTNVTGASQFSNLAVTRVVTPLDMVPLVPALSPLQLQELDIYWHIGEEVILMAGQEYAITGGLKSMLRASKFIDKAPDESNFEDHKMNRYLHLIQQKIEGAKQVPYVTGINLFGFSLD